MGSEGEAGRAQAYPHWWTHARRPMIVCIAVQALVTAFAFLEPWLWTADLAAQFRVQYVVAGVPLTAIAAAAGRRRLAGLGLACVLVHALYIAVPVGLPLATPRQEHGGRLRVLLINVHTENRDIGRTTALIHELDPDVIALLEVNRRWMEALTPALADWPYTAARAREDNFGIAAWSRLVPAEFGIFDLDDMGLPAVRGTFLLPEGELRLIVGHPLPPVSRQRWHARNDQTAAMFTALGPAAANGVLLGDFNAVPWSWHLRRHARAQGMRDARRGFGLHTSWPADSVAARLPLDGAYVGANWTVTAYRTERPIGSDHLPVYLELTPAQRETPARTSQAAEQPCGRGPITSPWQVRYLRSSSPSSTAG